MKISQLPIIKSFLNQAEKKNIGGSIGYHHISHVGQGSFTEFLLGHSRNINAKDTARFYRQASAVAIPVDKIAEEVERIVPVLQMEDQTIEQDHPVLDLLNQPNGFEDRTEFIGTLVRSFLLNHDAYIYAEGSKNRPPMSIWSPKPQGVHIRENEADRYPRTYYVSTGIGRGTYSRTKDGRKWRFLDGNLREIYHISGYSSVSYTHLTLPTKA